PNDNTNRGYPTERSGDFTSKKFIPYGISTYVSRGRITVYVTNSASNTADTVEAFQLDQEHLTLRHLKTISDTTFRSLADIAVVGADRFFVTNYAYSRARWLQIVEFALQTSFGSLAYYDGHRGIYLEKLYVRIYHLHKDMSISHDAEISLLSSPNKLFIEEATGDIWAALHPVLYKAHKHIQNPLDLQQRSPSQVLRIRLQPDGQSWVITEPFANDGATVWGSSSVVFHNGALLIGSLFGRLLHCDVDNPHIV
ncbi:unnamed protein product, partial [Gongylonema pulchrum]|uniref:Arylesterase n=1 Tax=Gongylonema pulchrum TaxID=637853 RepID=A0A183CVR4_9BILA